MPKLSEKSTQGFTPITKPSSETTSISTQLITPVPIHGNQQGLFIDFSDEFGKEVGWFFSEGNSMDEELINHSPRCRTIVSMLINQYKTNYNLEQQLKDLQSSSKATTSQSPIPTLQTSSEHSETFHFNPKRSAFDDKSSHSFCKYSSSSNEIFRLFFCSLFIIK